MEKKPTGFIRKRGRIIPIFSKKEKKLYREGSLSAAGGGLAILGGSYLTGKQAKYAKHFKAKGQVITQNVAALLSDPNQLRMQFFAKPMKILAFKRQGQEFKKALVLAKGAGTALRGTNLIGAAAVGLGVEKLLEASGIEAKGYIPELTSETVGVGSAVATEYTSRILTQKFMNGTSIRQQVKQSGILKKAARALIKRKLRI